MTTYGVSPNQGAAEVKAATAPPLCWYCGADALSQRTRRFPKTLTCDACGATTVPQLQVDMGADYDRIRARLRNPG